MQIALRTIVCALATALCLFGYQAAADWYVPALPVCRSPQEWRTPVPVWTPGLAKNGTLRSAPPEPTSSVIYIVVGVDSDAPACVEPPRDALFEFGIPQATPGAPNGLKVKIADDQMGEDSFHDCVFEGFYTTAPGAARADGGRELVLRPLDEFAIIASGRYCRAGATAAARLSHRAPVAPRAAPSESPRALLPTCRKTGEHRLEIPVWEPRLTSDGYLRSLPPQGDGKLVFMSIVSPIDCRGAAPDLELPDPGTDPGQSGTFVVPLGKFRSQNGHCVWSGLYMNDSVGFQKGFAITSFKQVDEGKVASSGQFCLARRHGPLHRPTPQE